MDQKLLIGGISIVVSLGALPAQEPEKPIDIKARKESVANLEMHIAQRETRLAEWAKDIQVLDTRIEKRVDELVKMLAGMRDSQESRTKVTQLKKEAIEGLKRGIQMYVQKRKQVRELARTGDTAATGDLGKFDVRIVKRVDQIAELTKSIPTHHDVAKYESDGGGEYWNGYYYESTRISEDWKQNRRDATGADQVRDETTKALRETLERLDQRRRSLADLLANRNITPAARQLYMTELGQIDAYQDHLNAQLREITVGTAAVGQAVGRDEAHDIEGLIDDARKDLREDVARLFQSYDRFVKGRAYIEGLKENLAARKAWLEKNAPTETNAQ
ncbi:MAG TPA: hypothetical protein VLO11_06900 [Luteolibacter sp.]|nr:hypothetical protein [Luteolibacter sp.]